MSEMEGIMNLLKYLLMFFNFVIFVSINLPFNVFVLINLFPLCQQVVGVVVFSIAIWAIVDAPKFTELFEKVKTLSSRSMSVRVTV